MESGEGGGDGGGRGDWSGGNVDNWTSTTTKKTLPKSKECGERRFEIREIGLTPTFPI